MSPHLTTSKHPHNSDPKNTMNKIDTPEGFRDTIDQLARDQKALQALEIEEAREILAVREQRKQRIEELKAKLKAANTEASRYLRKHDKKILGDKRSGETQLAEFGLLTSSSIVALNSDWKDDDTISECLARNFDSCVVTTWRLDKEALEKLDDEELATVGRRRRKKITFWFKPKTSADQRESSKV